MSVTGPEEALGADMRALVERVGVPLAEVTILTRLPSLVMAHASFRLRFKGGQVFKARRVESPAQAQRMHAILDALDARHFPRVLDRHGAALLEEWVPGEPLAPPVAPTLARRCGAVLGAVHRVAPPPGVAGVSGSAAELLDRLERQTGELVRLGALEPQAAARLLAIARVHAPRDVETGVIHRDFCAENMVLPEPERPCVVDNETVRIDAYDFDLARTWYRWPMTGPEQAAFLDGYAVHRNPAAYLGSFPFWAFGALVDTALFRWRAGTGLALVPLDRLEALLRDPTSGLPERPGARRGIPRRDVPTRCARGFRYLGLTVRVESSEPAHLAWLNEFLAPAFEPTDGAAWDRRVVLDTDPRRYAETLGRGPSPSGARPVCFVLDGRTVSHPEWRTAGEERVVFDQTYQAFYCLRPGEVRVLADGHVARARVALMRVTRELAMAASVERGALVLHAAAFAVGERGVVLAGPKGAGKTTLLLGALADGQAHFMSNDRAVVSFEEPGARVHGMPTIVAVRPETLAMFTDVAARIRDRSYGHHLTIPEATARAGPPDARVDRPASLTPAQFCDAAGAPARVEAALVRIVFPRLDPTVDAVRLEPLDDATAARQLTGALFGDGGSGGVSEVFSTSGGVGVIDPAALRRRCAELAARIPCYVCRLGPRAPLQGGVAEALLRG